MKQFFTMILYLMSVTIVIAHDTQNPWHLIAFENEEEVAFYNAEMIIGIEVTAQSVTIALDNGKEFYHPLATTTFGFDPRKEGTVMANESITHPQWDFHYTNGKLHFSETVNNITVYTVNGTLVGLFAGNYMEVSVHLVSGIYIVQANGKSAKMMVGSSGNGSSVTEQAVEAKNIHIPVPIGLRAGNVIKNYWNITASNSTMSVEISNVQKFYFTANNSIIFTLKNGNTIELADYNGIEFTIEPTSISANDWDLERTFAIGGGMYHAEIDDINDRFVYYEYISVVSKTDIIIYSISTQKETKYSRSAIASDKFLQNDFRITFTLRESDEWYQSFPLISKIEPTEYGDRIMLYFLNNNYVYGSHAIDVYNFNEGTDRICTTFEIDKDGNLIASYTNADGVTRQHTFKK